MTWPDSELKSCWQSPRSVLSVCLARLGTAWRTVAMHLVNCGGSVGTITGCPGLWAACDLAATYIQWLNPWVVIALPATEATESDGTPPLLLLLLPHAASRTETIATAPSASVVRMAFFTTTGEDSDPIYESVAAVLGLVSELPADAASASRITSWTRR